MTRRKHPTPVDPDDYGFDLVGDRFTVEPQELMCLVGLDALACQLYFICLRPWATEKAGDVREASYYRFIHRLTPGSSGRSGPRRKAPTRQQLRDALERLELAGLIRLYRATARRERVLQIRVVRRFGVPLSRAIGTKERTKDDRPQSRASA